MGHCMNLCSFSRAAQELFVTQSAVSHQVKQLEEWIGGALLDRSNNRPKLLPHAASLVATLTTAFTEMQKGCQMARDANESRALVIAVIPSVATCWLIPRMTNFRCRFPDMNIRIMYAIHGQHLDFREIDVALVYSNGQPAIPDVMLTRLLPGDSAPVCSQSFLDIHGPLSRPEAIARAGIIHDTDMNGWRRWFGKIGDENLAPPEGTVYEDFSLLRAATLAGQGVSLCPLSIIEDDLESGRLVQLSPVTILEESGYYLAEKTRNTKGFRWEIGLFHDWLLEI